MSFLHLGPKSTALHRIARKGNEHDLLQLLRHGADVTARDAEGRTPLHLAVMRGHLGIIKGLLEHGGPAVLLSRDVLNCTPVHLAAVQNQVQLISMLIAALLEDTSGCTPLHEVARRGCMQDFLGFVHLGWDIAACDGRNQEVLQLTSDASKTGSSSVQQILGWSALHLAAMEGKVSNIEKLIKKFNCDVHCQSANTWTPLHYAAAYNQVGSIEALVRLGAKVDVRDSVGSTPLHVACGEGHLPAVLKLIELGGDPAAKDRDGCTPLYCASAWNRIEVVRKLHSLGSPSSVQSEEGRTAVHVAAEQGWVDLIQVLVEELGCKVDSTDKYQFTPLHSAANWGWVDAISKLVELNHAVDVKDNIGQTPLHYAALHGRTAAIHRLVESGAKLKDKDSRGGYTPLHLAADAGQCEAVAKLIKLGADTEAKTAKGWTCLHLATMKGPGNVDVIELLVELGANLKYATNDRNVETPLHIAARAGRNDVVLRLIQHGADVSARTKDGSTPLHYAAAFGQSHVIEALVKAGCPVDSRDNPKNTPLHLAAGCGFLDAVVKLVALGADRNARDISECTPLQNTAHGTYSALAHVPPGVPTNTTGQLQGLGSLSLRRSGLSSAVFPKPNPSSCCNSCSEDSSSCTGMVPVRTGFAWATLSNTESLSNMYLNDLDSSSSTTSTTTTTTTTTRLCRNWKGAELMSLLRKATRGMHPGSLFVNPESILDQGGPITDQPLPPPPQPRLHGPPGNSEDWEKRSHRDFEWERESLEFLLKKTEALQMSHMEQDRSRLLPVAEKLVELGAEIGAQDNEGRTALHLAAGCGDKLMVFKLVELGADVNSRDSVGGTAMHHAAMANKKEMMFTLALLGCDWRAKADGIDGASPAFVLCGQHGKTTRQQKLLEAKLKRVYLGGEAARKTKKGGCFEESWEKNHEEEEDYEEKLERADANMAALLEEVAAEEAAAAASKKSTRRKPKKPQTVSNPSSCAFKLSIKKTKDLPVKEKLDLGDLESTELSVSSPCAVTKASIKQALDEAVTCVNIVLEIGEVAGKEAMLDVKEKIDNAIATSVHNKVGTKYAKKVRKKLQSLIDKQPEDKQDTSQTLLKEKMDSMTTANEEIDQGWVKTTGPRKKQTNRRRSGVAANEVWQPVSQQKSRVPKKEEKQQPIKCSPMPKSPSHGNEDTLSTPPGKPRPSPGRKSSEKRGSIVVMRTSSGDYSHLKSPGSKTVVTGGAWDHQKSPSLNSCSLSDPDFPPLKSSSVNLNSSFSTNSSTKTSHRKSESAQNDTSLSSSQDSTEDVQKTELDASLLSPPAIQSNSSVSSSSVCISTGTGVSHPCTDHAVMESYPQYELFGNSTSPALSSTMGSIPPILSDSITSTTMPPSDYPHEMETPATGAGDMYSLGGDQGANDGSTMSMMMMPGSGYGPMGGYPAVTGLMMMPPLFHPVSYEAMNAYSQSCLYTTHPCQLTPYGGVPLQHYPSMAAAIPIQPSPMNEMDADEIANKLPKEIPGLVESGEDEEESYSRSCLVSIVTSGPVHQSLGRMSPPPVDGQNPISRHLLGDLASELEA